MGKNSTDFCVAVFCLKGVPLFHVVKSALSYKKISVRVINSVRLIRHLEDLYRDLYERRRITKSAMSVFKKRKRRRKTRKKAE